jgi:hypothetical protein
MSTAKAIKALTPRQFAKARKMPLDLLMRELWAGNIGGVVKLTTYRIAAGAVTRYSAYNLPKAAKKSKKGGAK